MEEYFWRNGIRLRLLHTRGFTPAIEGKAKEFTLSAGEHRVREGKVLIYPEKTTVLEVNLKINCPRGGGTHKAMAHW